MPSSAPFDKRFRLAPAAALGLFLLFCALPLRAQDTAISAPRETIQSAPSNGDALPGAQAEKTDKAFSQALPPEVEETLSYLLSLVDKRGSTLDTSRLGPLLALVQAQGLEPQRLKPEKRENASGVCLRQEIQAPLERILRYGYNKDIPNHVIFPSVLRLTGWQPGSDILQLKQGLWDQARGELAAPVLLWGREYEVNTPDSSTGAYYRYDLDRFLALFRSEGRNVFVSVSRMPHESDPGKKGVPMDDQNWNYFYSGIDGLDMGLVGWMSTTLYNSLSVQVFMEEQGQPRTTCLLFKWLGGGWAGLNVIMAKHIYDGNLRFIKGFKKVMESGALPDSERFAAAVREINNLPAPVLDEKINSYAHAFEQLARNFPSMDKSSFRKIWQNGNYASVLDHDQRIGVLVLEYMKAKVGKPVLVDLSAIDRAVAERAGGPAVAAVQTAPEQGGTP